VITEIRVSSSPGEARIAVTRDGDLVDYAVWPFGSPDGVGDLHRGRVIRHVPAMAGAFVAIAGAEGFLPDSEGAKGLTEGAMLTVRITRSAQGGKGPRLSARGGEPDDVAGSASGGVALLRRGPDPLTRLVRLWPDAAIVLDDPGLPTRLAERARIDRAGFDEALLAQVEALAETEIALPHGARASFHPTPALVAIDVDAGAATSRGHAEVNRAVIPALVRQIALRNLSGAILIDFAGMPARKRQGLGPALGQALAQDRLKPRLLGFTALGLAEIVRSRVHPPLHEVLAGPLSAGLAGLRQALAWMLEQPGRAVRLVADPAVIGALEADGAGLADLVRRAGMGVALRADPDLPRFNWRVER